MRGAVLIVCLWSGAVAVAETAQRACVELLAARASAIGHVRVERLPNEMYEITVIEMFSGKAKTRFLFDPRTASFDIQLGRRDPFPRWNDGRPREFILLASSTELGAIGAYYNAVALGPSNGQTPFSMDKKPLRTREEVIAAVKEGIGVDAPGAIGVTVRDPATGEKFWLMIPKGYAAVDLARQWVRDSDVQVRLEAVWILAESQMPRDTEILRSLLGDTGTKTWHSFLSGSREVYAVRHYAATALDRRGVDFGMVEPDAPSWQVVFLGKHARGVVLAGGVLLVAPMLYFNFRRSWRKRGWFVERLGVGRMLFDAACLVSFVAAWCVTYYWGVSHGKGATFTHQRGRLDTFIGAQSGKLHCTRLERRENEDWLVTADWGDGLNWKINDLADLPPERKRFSFAGVIVAERLPVGSELHGRIAVQVRMWVLWAVTMALPLVWLMRQVRFARRRRWASEGCCVECGYDLRHSAGRCPECGTELCVPPIGH